MLLLLGYSVTDVGYSVGYYTYCPRILSVLMGTVSGPAVIFEPILQELFLIC